MAVVMPTREEMNETISEARNQTLRKGFLLQMRAILGYAAQQYCPSLQKHGFRFTHRGELETPQIELYIDIPIANRKSQIIFWNALIAAHNDLKKQVGINYPEIFGIALPYKIMDLTAIDIGLDPCFDAGASNKLIVGRSTGLVLSFGRKPGFGKSVWNGLYESPPQIDVNKFAKAAQIFFIRLEHFLKRYQESGLAAVEKLNARGMKAKPGRNGTVIITLSDDKNQEVNEVARRRLQSAARKSNELGKGNAATLLIAKREITTEVQIAISRETAEKLAVAGDAELKEIERELLSKVASHNSWQAPRSGR